MNPERKERQEGNPEQASQYSEKLSHGSGFIPPAGEMNPLSSRDNTLPGIRTGDGCFPLLHADPLIPWGDKTKVCYPG
jgi:hypothetical protein